MLDESHGLCISMQPSFGFLKNPNLENGGDPSSNLGEGIKIPKGIFTSLERPGVVVRGHFNFNFLVATSNEGNPNFSFSIVFSTHF